MTLARKKKDKKNRKRNLGAIEANRMLLKLIPLHNHPISGRSKHGPKWTTILKGQAGTNEISEKYSTIKGGLRKTMTKPSV